MTVGRTFYDRAKSAAGRRLLLRVLQRVSQVGVGARCRVSQFAVSKWASGRDRPCARAQGVLLEVYAIPLSAWGELRTRTSRPGGRRRGSL